MTVEVYRNVVFVTDCHHGVPGDMFCGACEDEKFVEDLTEEAPNMLGTDVDAVLTERGSRYGKFTEHARITQNLKRAMADSPNWATLPDDTKETLEMVAHKFGRMLNGDPEYVDNVVDVIGYMQLILDRMEGKTQ